MRGELEQHNRPDQIVLHLTRAELLLAANCMNEAIEAVQDWKFPVPGRRTHGRGEALRAELPGLIAARPSASPGSGRPAPMRRRPSPGDLGRPGKPGGARNRSEPISARTRSPQ